MESQGVGFFKYEAKCPLCGQFHVFMESQGVGFFKLPQVLEILPFSRSAWFAGVRGGIYPKPVKLSSRTSAWRKSDILQLVEQLSKGEGQIDE